METVDGKLVVCKSLDTTSLSLYPLPVWEKLEALIQSWPMSLVAQRRKLIGSATDLEIDSSSRVLLPPELREWAGLKLEGKVKFMGVGNYFELWDVAHYDQYETEQARAEPPPEMRSLVLQ
jgi:MraZ protein